MTGYALKNGLHSCKDDLTAYSLCILILFACGPDSCCWPQKHLIYFPQWGSAADARTRTSPQVPTPSTFTHQTHIMIFQVRFQSLIRDLLLKGLLFEIAVLLNVHGNTYCSWRWKLFSFTFMVISLTSALNSSKEMVFVLIFAER